MNNTRNRAGSSLFFHEDATLDIKRVFLLGLGLGTVAIIGGQILNSPWLSVFLSILVMSVYIWIGLYRDAAKPILPQFADSIYYMGFLFTLEALVASLYEFHTRETPDVGDLVSYFSLALITTIIGLSARIVITSFNKDAHTTRQEITDSLNSATLALTQNARAISTRLEVLNTEVHDTIQQSLSESKQSMSETIDDFKNKITSIELPSELFVDRMMEPIEQFVERADKTQNMLKEIATQQRNVRDNSRRVAESLERAAKRIDKMEGILDKYSSGIETDFVSRQQFVEFTRVMTQLSQTISTNMQEITEKMQDIPDVIQVTTENMRDGGAALHQMTQSFTKNIGMADSIESDLASIGDSIKTANLGFMALSETAHEHVAIFKKHQDELERILQESRQSLEALNEHFVDAANYVTSRLGN